MLDVIRYIKLAVLQSLPYAVVIFALMVLIKG